jgi:hypothetical protein
VKYWKLSPGRHAQMAETNAMELQRDASGCVKSEPKMESMQSVDDTIGEHDKDIPRLADRVPPQVEPSPFVHLLLSY